MTLRMMGLLLSVALWAQPVQALTRGDAAPAFQLATNTGEQVSLASLQGQLVYLDFWASWCGPCRESFPWLNRLQSRFAGQGLKVVAINVDSDREAAQGFLQRYPAQFTVLYDPSETVSRQYALPGMPVSFLIAPDGRIIGRHVGFRKSDGDKLEAAIAQLLSKR